MGRGRAKAKQTKVARELKYSSPNTDYNALQRELGGGGNGHSGPGVAPADAETDAEADPEIDSEPGFDSGDGSDGDERWASSR